MIEARTPFPTTSSCSIWKHKWSECEKKTWQRMCMLIEALQSDKIEPNISATFIIAGFPNKIIFPAWHSAITRPDSACVCWNSIYVLACVHLKAHGHQCFSDPLLLEGGFTSDGDTLHWWHHSGPFCKKVLLKAMHFEWLIAWSSSLVSYEDFVHPLTWSCHRATAEY